MQRRVVKISETIPNVNISYYKMYFTELVVIAIILIIRDNHVSNAVQIENNEVCGVKRTDGVANTANGTNVTQSDYPWQVAVYDAKKKYICGGSLIRENIALSAAYCFADSEGKILPKENYHIAGGKYYIDYEDERDHNAQYSEINAIHVSLRYKGIINHYEADIALIILSTPFTLSTNIQLVCVDFEKTYDELNVENVGIATGWNIIDDQTEGLRDVSVSYTPYDVCFDEVPRTFRRFITYDKFCGAYSNNVTSILPSGGSPLIFPDNNERYFVRGILNASPGTTIEGMSDSNQYTTFTSVAKHIDFIKYIVTLV